ncbi:uncharacterized protein F5891DRAFT_1281675 [Suillus fuscotomentosus]|uniref:Uncharacterized protein n=1 Tax=Suillus fuscotomentosus TaxID=1912939 RepID=A0AAD4DV05_9AGAM|nr:uncharacterized protein F5891DRAFT_1281675 [Suillus fuscotomentosus]KAG1894377.1 hypothetical protein F5891DRAFT_1281675 [Suillus fuscotomentosus]
MSTALLEVINLFNGAGAIIFVERYYHGPPQFHIVPCVNIKDSPSRPGAHEPAIRVLVVSEHVCMHPTMFAAVIWSIAHDPGVVTVCTESEELAELLAHEAGMICCVECGEDVHS